MKENELKIIRDSLRSNFIKSLKHVLVYLSNNTQTCIIQFQAGMGWDWINGYKENKEEDNKTILLQITKDEIQQCIGSGEEFVVYVNFGKGYRFLHIPLNSIKTIFIGEIISTNYIKSPLEPIPFDLNNETLSYLFDGENISESENLENKEE